MTTKDRDSTAFSSRSTSPSLFLLETEGACRKSTIKMMIKKNYNQRSKGTRFQSAPFPLHKNRCKTHKRRETHLTEVRLLFSRSAAASAAAPESPIFLPRRLHQDHCDRQRRGKGERREMSEAARYAAVLP